MLKVLNEEPKEEEVAYDTSSENEAPPNKVEQLDNEKDNYAPSEIDEQREEDMIQQVYDKHITALKERSKPRNGNVLAQNKPHAVRPVITSVEKVQSMDIRLENVNDKIQKYN